MIAFKYIIDDVVLPIGGNVFGVRPSLMSARASNTKNLLLVDYRLPVFYEGVFLK